MSDDPADGITITAEGATIHASEKVSTGDYETATVSKTLDLNIEGVDLEDGVPVALRNRLLAIQRDLQRDVERAGENRVKIRDHEQWGVGDNGGER